MATIDSTKEFRQMNENLIKNAPARAMKNRKGLKGSCGCYRCLEIFNVSEIKEWTDGNETAICPKCDSDTVLKILSPNTLSVVHDYWFKK